jgi:hypothetical protein
MPESDFFIHTEHQCPLRRTHIESDDISHLFHKEGIGGKFELLLTVGLEAEGTPDTGNRVMTQPRFLGHRACAPMGGVLGFAFRVRVMIFSISPSLTLRGGPLRGASPNACNRFFTNRLRHLPTVAGVVLNTQAISWWVLFSAQAKTIRARSA